MPGISLRILPCKTCRKPALATRDPEVFVIAGRIHGHSMTYLCRRCGRSTRLTAPEFAQLPVMREREVIAQSCDISGMALGELGEQEEREKK